MTLIDRLLQLSRLWCAAQDRSVSRLATIVANDGKLLTRLADGATCTVATFEKFLAFFREPANWPEQSIPAEAAQLLDEVEMIATGGAASVGKELQISAHDLMAPPRSHDWPIQSANNGAEIIGREDQSPLAPEAAAAEGGHGHPFGHGSQPPSSPICSPTRAPPPPSPASPASSAAGRADAA